MGTQRLALNAVCSTVSLLEKLSERFTLYFDTYLVKHVQREREKKTFNQKWKINFLFSQDKKFYFLYEKSFV